MRAAIRGVGCATLALGLAASARAAPALPSPGRYAAELCVSTRAGEPSCGPARAEIEGAGVARVSISDVEYRLQLRAADVDVILFHGRMQVDEFSAALRQDGRRLRFADDEKGTRYEIRFGRRER